MAQLFAVHPDNPQQRLIRQAAAMVREGAVIAYPTDSSYALGCHLGDKDALQRMRQIRGVGEDHYFTLMCRDLSEISHYARVNNVQFRQIKHNTPGSYTFILVATKEVPRRLQHPKRSTVGLRIPDNAVALALLEELGEPLLSTTLILPGDEGPLGDAEEIRTRLDRQVDLVLDGGSVGNEPTTVIDLTGEAPEVLRLGRGDISPFGMEA
ncbi:MAG TPA: L-threonylcarbamoyladenylate synthase [Gallionellaceae bacterium]|nr:L-threonylcarbamoyladenylate synthase [Gallionellaceae bacterium]